MNDDLGITWQNAIMAQFDVLSEKQLAILQKWYKDLEIKKSKGHQCVIHFFHPISHYCIPLSETSLRTAM